MGSEHRLVRSEKVEVRTDSLLAKTTARNTQQVLQRDRIDSQEKRKNEGVCWEEGIEKEEALLL